MTDALAAAKTARFWDRIAERYARKPVADAAAYQRKLEITRALLRPDMEVLEIGCGTGTTALAHAPFAGRITAIDVSAGMLAIAERKALTSGTANVEFRCLGIEQFVAPAASYDAVLALSILHLLADRDAALAKVHRLLKPGGVFVSSTVCLGESLHWFQLVAPLGRALGLLPLVRFFSIEDLGRALRNAGFEIEQEWRPARGRKPGHVVFIVARKPG